MPVYQRTLVEGEGQVHTVKTHMLQVNDRDTYTSHEHPT